MNNHVDGAARKRHATSAAQLCALLVPGTAAWTYRLHFSIQGMVWTSRCRHSVAWCSAWYSRAQSGANTCWPPSGTCPCQAVALIAAPCAIASARYLPEGMLIN